MLIGHHLTIRSEESDGQKDPQKYKNPNKSFQVRCKIFCEHLVYTFIYTFSLARTTFPNIKHSVVCAEFPMGYKINLYQFIDKFLKFKEMEYMSHSLCQV